MELSETEKQVIAEFRKAQSIKTASFISETEEIPYNVIKLRDVVKSRPRGFYLAKYGLVARLKKEEVKRTNVL